MRKIYILVTIILFTIVGCSFNSSEEHLSPEEELSRNIIDSVSNLKPTEYIINYNGSEIVLKINSEGNYVIELIGQDINITYLDGESFYCYEGDMCTEADQELFDIHEITDMYIGDVQLGSLQTQEGNVLTFSNGDEITVNLENETITIEDITIKTIDDFEVELPDDYEIF